MSGVGANFSVGMRPTCFSCCCFLTSQTCSDSLPVRRFLSCIIPQSIVYIQCSTLCRCCFIYTKHVFGLLAFTGAHAGTPPASQHTPLYNPPQKLLAQSKELSAITATSCCGCRCDRASAAATAAFCTAAAAGCWPTTCTTADPPAAAPSKSSSFATSMSASRCDLKYCMLSRSCASTRAACSAAACRPGAAHTEHNRVHLGWLLLLLMVVAVHAPVRVCSAVVVWPWGCPALWRAACRLIACELLLHAKEKTQLHRTGAHTALSRVLCRNVPVCGCAGGAAGMPTPAPTPAAEAAPARSPGGAAASAAGSYPLPASCSSSSNHAQYVKECAVQAVRAGAASGLCTC